MDVPLRPGGSLLLADHHHQPVSDGAVPVASHVLMDQSGTGRAVAHARHQLTRAPRRSDEVAGTEKGMGHGVV